MQSIKVHRHRVNCLAAHKTLLFSGSHDYYLRAISQLDFSQVAACRHARHVTALVNDDRLLVSGAQDTLIRVFSLENVLQRLTVLRGHSGRVNSLALFSAAHLASCANDE
jgi:WD40 repeat protein